jgi:serine phosphatase RsbU (regulator of sigma subunit)
MERTGGVSLRTRVALFALLGVVVLVVAGLLVRAAYVDVATSTRAVQDAAPVDRGAALDGLPGVAPRNAVARAVAGAAFLALGVSAYVLVRRWVLTPLDDLGRQLRGAARHGRRDEVIDATGPPEIRSVGHDAEEMRRALVAEADAARAAGEGLEQESPVVAAIRRELAVDPDPVADGLTVHGRLRPAHGVLAGDWWGVVPLEGGRTALVVLDVSGHGSLAGLVTMRLRSVLGVALRSGFDAGTVLSRAATALVDEGGGRFATALVAVLDPTAGTLSWANAGHPPGWLLPRGATEGRVPLAPTGPLLSALGGSWETRGTALDPGDVLLAWSDGLVESRDAADEVSDDSLAARLDAVPTREPRELVPALLAELRADAPEWSRDDITLVAVRRDG